MLTLTDFIHDGKCWEVFQVIERPFMCHHLPEHNAKAEDITFLRV